MKELFKETWSDYWKNLFNPNAPITRDNYMRERWFLLIFIIPAIFIWFVITMNNGMNSDDYYNMSQKAQQIIEYRVNFINTLVYMILLLILFIFSYALEMRMFKRRGKSPRLYLILNGLFFIIGFTYCIVTYFTGHNVQFVWVLLSYLIVSWSSNNNIMHNREEDQELE